MRICLYISALLLCSVECLAQKSLLGTTRPEQSFITGITAKCNAEAKKWSIAEGNITRRYENGFDYVLIDTAGLFIYVRKNNLKVSGDRTLDGFFSKDACSEIYRLEYYSIKKNFKEYIDFVKALKKEPDARLVLTSASGKTTVVNELYQKYVRSRQE